ncbi:amidohydrolase family protein [Nocardia brasiliensis]|uniref:Amidohydrolase n=1 Tax=Nocardia brasiliensis (strain ATCC 700358 / HUJEG-1) TaxID=1133849 RepID=K0F662_NOCB7|nr:amidohydrolase family protein [Nocardia brasiliensis]AFU02936.1 amidohydrolase [Nocardia brasiliensis ATCC 700358]OCF86010.1 hypothetical protein AW168_33140 [Nocardia brasiliensis]
MPVLTGRFVLPDVTIAHADEPDQEHVDVYVRDRLVDEIRPSGQLAAGDVTVIDDARGTVVTSALIDMHTHMPADNMLHLTDLFLLQTLRHGITIVRDAGDPDGTAIPAALSRVISGALPGPDIRYAYGFVGAAPARFPNAFSYDHPEQATEIVDRLLTLGATWVKSYDNIDLPRVAALREAAQEAGLGVLGHVPSGLGHDEALLPDAQHLFGVPPPRSLRRDHVLNRSIDWHAVDSRRVDVIRRASIENQLTLTPTLDVTMGILELDRYPEALQEETALAMPPFYSRVMWHPHHGLPAYRDISRDDFERARRALDRKRDLVARLHADGVPILLGTDTQQPFVAPGVALHRELHAFDQAGIPRREAFAAATTTAASALGLTTVGKVRPGMRAELLISRNDPHHMPWSVNKDLTAVVVNGALIRTADLDAAIARELHRFEGVFTDFTQRLLAQLSLRRLAKGFVR